MTHNAKEFHRRHNMTLYLLPYFIIPPLVNQTTAGTQVISNIAHGDQA